MVTSGVHANVLGVLLSTVGGDFDKLHVVAVAAALLLPHLFCEQQSHMSSPVGGCFDVLGVVAFTTAGGDSDVLDAVAVTSASLPRLSGKQQSDLYLSGMGGRLDVLGVVTLTAAVLSHVSGEQQSKADCKHLARGGDCSRLVCAAQAGRPGLLGGVSSEH